MEATGD